MLKGLTVQSAGLALFGFHVVFVLFCLFLRFLSLLSVSAVVDAVVGVWSVLCLRYTVVGYRFRLIGLF